MTRKRVSAGAVVVRQVWDGFRFLMLRAFNHWDFPKGIVEDRDSAGRRLADLERRARRGRL